MWYGVVVGCLGSSVKYVHFIIRLYSVFCGPSECRDNHSLLLIMLGTDPVINVLSL